MDSCFYFFIVRFESFCGVSLDIEKI